MIWRVRRHIAVQIQRFRHRSCTKDQTSSISRISSACAGRSVSSTFGFCSSFFEPTRQHIAADTESALNTTHTGAFIVCRQYLFFLLWRVAMFWLQDTAFAAVFAPELLTAIGIVTVLDNILASASSTLEYDCFCDHLPRLPYFTYCEP
jgi:hypothetical protein